MKINNSLKIRLMAGIFVLFLVLCFVFINQVIDIKPETKEETVFTHTAQPMVYYEVEIERNKIYEDDRLTEDAIYISAYVKNIHTAFSYLIHNTENVKVTGNYSIQARLESRVSSTEDGTFWTKEYELMPLKELDLNGANYEIKEDIVIDYQLFDAISKEMKELTELTSYDVLIVSMPINYVVDSPYGIIPETAMPQVIIPLDQKYFSIQKADVEEKANEISGTVTITVPVNKKRVLFLGGMILILGFTIFYLKFHTEPYSQKDLFEIKIKKIFRNYGQRLVAMNSNIEYKDENNKVRSMEDLIKISDELNKPILYKYHQNLSEINRFYLIDNEIVFIFIIE